MFDLTTLNDVFAKLGGRGDAVAILWQDADGLWKPISSIDLHGRVRAFADTLRSWGVGKGDRVAILSENRWEWPVTDFAVLALGAVDVPLYATLPGDQIGFMLRDCAAKVLVVSSEEQLHKLSSAGDLPALQHVVVMDASEFPGAESFGRLLSESVAKPEADLAFGDALRAVRGEDLATIIYTSGTTGDPKGVMLTHGNIASNINFSTTGLGFNEKDTCISFLPLSHITARHVDYALMCYGARLAYCPRFDLLPEAMKAVKPTVFVAVPRVYEKIRHAVEAKSGASPIRSRLLRWALGQGMAHRAEVLEGRAPGAIGWSLANKLVFAKIREAFGGGVRTFISGGAPLGVDTASWFADAGIRIFEGYGLTETSPVIAVNIPSAHRLGTVGKPLENVEIRFAGDGELEVRAPSVFPGYWNRDKETGESFDDAGWFKTGDIGHLDESGYLSITDRKKELLKTSGGKLIAPQPIENRLKANALIAQAALVGDKHKFASVLISPNFAALEGWAKGQGISAGDRAALVSDQRVLKLYQGAVDEVNGKLAHHETIKRICVVKDEWSIEDGELTPSMKLKRRVIEQKYRREIGAFYADEASSRGSGA